MPDVPPTGRSWALTSYAALVVAGVVALVAPALVDRLAWAPLIASLVVFGMAHGAVDHHVPQRLGLTPAGPRRIGLIAAYVLVACAAFALWFLSPPAALVAFLVVALLHWGQGDLWFARAVNGRAAPASAAAAAAFVLARGALPIVLPVIAFPAAAAAAGEALLAPFPGEPTAPLLAGAARAAAAVLLAAVVAGAALASIADHRGRRGAAFRRDLGELGLLAVFFVTVPAVFAVGVYFLVWHAPRHVVRLMDGHPRQGRLLRSGRPLAALAAFHAEALPATLAALAGLAVLAGVTVVGDSQALAAAALALIAALTYPHALVVAWMDLRQGVWRRTHDARRPRARSAPGAVASR